MSARGNVNEIVRSVNDLPAPARQALTGAVVLGLLGGLVGLVLGLVAYPPTAWAAVFELGIPATLVGLLGGLLVGLVVRAAPMRQRVCRFARN